MKRRKLEPGQKVLIIYTKQIGFIQEPATFQQYTTIKLKNNISHQIPEFKFNDKLITGLDCFWILPEDAKTQERIERIQYELISVQVKAMELAHELKVDIPVKIKDKEIQKMATENIERMDTIAKKFGFDPRDESWIENDLASNDLERKWFSFERENPLFLDDNWDDIVPQFNQKFDLEIDIDQAKNMSKKRMRYLLGAFNTRMSGNGNREDWINAARSLEEKYRGIENRMLTWSLAHKDKFPLVKTKEPIFFFAGNSFHDCLEKIPHYFTDEHCNHLVEGTVLRVVSYDPEEKHIRLDFPENIRKLLTGEISEKPWIYDKESYIIFLNHYEITDKLETLDSLE